MSYGSGLWNSSPEIFQQDLAAGFLVPRCFKCASFTLPIELESRHLSGQFDVPFLCPGPLLDVDLACPISPIMKCDVLTREKWIRP